MDMNRREIADKLRQAMKRASSEEVDWDALTEETGIESLGFDSLSVLDLIYDIQQEFSIDFDPEELAAVRTVGELISFLERRASA